MHEKPPRFELDCPCETCAYVRELEAELDRLRAIEVRAQDYLTPDAYAETTLEQRSTARRILGLTND